MKKGTTFLRKTFTEKEIEILLSRFDDGRKHKEIAAELGRSEKSVSSKLEALSRKRKRNWSENEKKGIEKTDRSAIAKKVMKCRMKKMSE